uniref:Mesoderm induction early response protein 1 n=1 Tax=Glossina palpalis gambiensis TaxID=67801 RepID=A0A1B0BE63_9MUSC
MSPDPIPSKPYESNVMEVFSTQMQTPSINVSEQQLIKKDETAKSIEAASSKSVKQNANHLNELIPPSTPIPPIRDNKRNHSPNIASGDILDAMSPSSCSSTSQATSGVNDVTFEPTIEMMVNDFDDEQTLNEEEALAALESQDPHEEINTLRAEGEMPLEELMAKYQALPAMPFIEPIRKKSKKSKKAKKYKQKDDNEELTPLAVDQQQQQKASNQENREDVIVIESSDEKEAPDDMYDRIDEEDEVINSNQSVSKLSTHEETKDNEELAGPLYCNKIKVRRSHLLDLYPEGTFDNVVVNSNITDDDKDIPLEMLYGVGDDEDEDIEEDDDYKKKVMVGSSYQATIPVGLSQYGDILPYENEDKLIWEPSQVGEREVEEYLLKIRDIKPNLSDEIEAGINEENSQVKENAFNENGLESSESKSTTIGTELVASSASDYEICGVIKDNEQALHLLVQCGYDFKEALRRKRLNALPLNDCMSLWSEEECQKFEEGIQKYGKDFLKIRQNQVRTRTLRELVQFYYLWKKSERRDHNFANADTVDHMDIYLNEDNEYGSNPASSLTPAGSPVTTSICAGTRRNSSSSQKNFSIMTGVANSNVIGSVNANSAIEHIKGGAPSGCPNADKRRFSNSTLIGPEHSLESSSLNVNTSSNK